MKEKINKKSVIAGFALMFFGVLFVVFTKTEWVRSVAESVLASGIVILVTAILVDRVAVNPLDEWGIKNVFLTRQLMNKSCDTEIVKAKHQIDVVAFGLKHFRQEMDIESVLKRGVKFRIITMDPQSDYVEQREREEMKQPGNIKQSIEDLIKWADELNRKKYKGSIEIKGYSCMTLDFYWRVDDILFVGPYWYDYDSQSTVSYCYKGGEGFSLYTQYFDKLWNNETIMKTLTVQRKQ